MNHILIIYLILAIPIPFLYVFEYIDVIENRPFQRGYIFVKKSDNK